MLMSDVGFGAVYVARQRSTRNYVAVKFEGLTDAKVRDHVPVQPAKGLRGG